MSEISANNIDMKKFLHILDVSLKSLAVLIILVCTSFIVLAMAPRNIESGTTFSDPNITQYFEATSCEKIMTSSGEVRIIVKLDDIDERELVIKSKKLAEENLTRRMVITFVSLEESLVVVVDENYNAYVES